MLAAMYDNKPNITCILGTDLIRFYDVKIIENAPH